MHSDGVIKPKTKRSKRFLDNRAAKLTENVKSAIIMKGGNTSQTITQTLKDIYSLKKPSAVLYKKKNITRPFEDSTSLEFFSKKSDSSLFLFGSHNKKRPNNLIFGWPPFALIAASRTLGGLKWASNSLEGDYLLKLIKRMPRVCEAVIKAKGRLFDFHVLDMIELGIEKYVSLADIKVSKCPEGTKPMLVFAGEAFDTDVEHKRLKSLLIDFFRGPTVSAVRLAGLEHILHFTAVDGRIYMRSYRSLLKKSGCRTPRIELEEMGPSLDLILRRTHLASDDLYKLAHRQPKALKPKKKKNISHDAFGTKFGRVHMQKQDLSKLHTRKMKGLKKRRAVAEEQPTPAPTVES